MTVRAFDAWRFAGGRDDHPKPELGSECSNLFCGFPAAHVHHIFSRAQASGAYDWIDVWMEDVWMENAPDETLTVCNVTPLCFSCHSDIHEHRAGITLVGRSWHWHGADGKQGRLRPHPPELGGGEDRPQGAGTPDNPSVVFPPLSPGEDCPTCNRRVPHPKKPTSPKTRTYGFRIPVEEIEQFEEILDSAADHLGCRAEPRYKLKTILSALVLLLQEHEPGRRVA